MRDARPLKTAIRTYGQLFPLVFLTAFAMQWSRTDAGRDTAILFVGAANPRVGESIYHLIPEPGVFRQQSVYNYPPPLGAALQPLTHLRYETFARFWLIVLSIGFWIFAAASARIVFGSSNWGSTTTAGGLLFLTPGVVHSWNMGNADVLVWTLVAVGFASRGTVRGAALMSAALLKVTPLFAFIFACRDRRALNGGMIAVVLASLIMVLSLGVSGAVDESHTFLRDVAPTLAQGEHWITGRQEWTILGLRLPSFSPGNLSLAFLPLQVLRRTVLPLWARLWLLSAGVGFPLVTGVLLRRRPDAQIAGVLVMSVLWAPIMRLNYLPMLVPPGLVIWRAARSKHRKTDSADPPGSAS